MNFSQFLATAHILKMNCDKMAGDRPRQPAYQFLALNADFSNSSLDPLGSKRPAQASIKKGTFLKSGHFTSISSSSVKTVARYAQTCCLS